VTEAFQLELDRLAAPAAAPAQRVQTADEREAEAQAAAMRAFSMPVAG
jgi:HD superfamily phosphodiesterase